MSEERRCAECGREARGDDRFCGGCGKPLTEPAKSASPPTAGVSRPALHELFAHLRSGEQRPATILMTDLAGYSTLGENADPEWVFNLLNHVFSELVECLVAHGAHIDKYVGDEIVALFGVPVAQERTAERALRAALAMHARLTSLNREGRFGRVGLQIHTGINIGPVMVGPVGHRTVRNEWTVIGDAVNVAKRLEDAAPEGQIYVSQAVRDSVAPTQSGFEFEEVDDLPLAGRMQRVMVYRLLGLRGGAARPSLSLTEDTRLFGHEREREELHHHAHEALLGRQTCVCIAGPPGIGKSRAIAEWMGSEQGQAFRAIPVRCYAFGEHFPLLPVVEAVTQLAGLRLGGWPSRVVGDVAQAISHLSLSPSECHALQQLLFRAEPRSIGAESDEHYLAHLCRATDELLQSACETQPLCLAIEDVQWMDEASREVLAELLSQRQKWPLLSVLSARSPGDEWVVEALGAEVVRLTPLPRGAMAQLVQAAATPRVLPARTVEAICDRAQGNPYFAHELVRGLSPETSGPTSDFAADVSLPGTLQELFLSQLDRLPSPLRHLVQSASVIGEPLSYPLLEATMGRDSPLMPTLLGEATTLGLIHAGPAVGQFAFGRRLLFETAYSTIPPTQRQDLHGRIADYLLEQLDTLGDAVIHSAAHHAYAGYRDERALDLLLRSAQRYRGQYANRQAIKDATRSLELIGSLPQSGALQEQRLRALLLLAQSYEVVGDLGHAEGALSEAEILSEDCVNDELVAQIATSAATLRLMQGKTKEAERGFRRACLAWERIGNDLRVAHALLGLGMCVRQGGDRELAIEVFRLSACRGAEALWVKAAALNNVGMILLEEGRYEDSEPYLREGLAANEQEGDRRGIAHSKSSLGEMNLRRGRYVEAEQWLHESVEEAERIDDAECAALTAAMLARTLTAQGRTEQAQGLLSRYDHFIASINDLYVQCVVQLARRDVRGEVGEWKEVLSEIVEYSRSENVTRSETPDNLVNAIAETLCLGMEIALRHRKHQQAAELGGALEEIRPDITDEHLKRFVSVLLRLREESYVADTGHGEDFFSKRLKRIFQR